MTTAYLLAFALGVIPCLGYLVGVAFLGLGLSRLKQGAGRLAAWLPTGAAVLAFALAIFQGVTFDGLFFDWTLSGVRYATVLGVEIPFEVGESAASLTSAIFIGLVFVWSIITLGIALFRSRDLSRIQRVMLTVSGLGLGWGVWLVFRDGLVYWQRLF